ncbi:MAG: efflux RND transporter permease subunit, partial [Victivallaceae bacterium]
SGEVGNLLRQLPGVSDVIEIPGFNILNSTPAERSSFLVIILKPWQEREAAKLNSQKIMEMAQFESLTKIPNVLCMFFQPPAIPGIGMAGGFNLVLEERTGTDSDLLSAMVEAIQLAALRDPKLSNVFSAYSAGTPAVYLKIDREKAMRLGVAMSQIDAVLQNELGFTFINQFNRFGQVYKVELQAQSNQRQSVESILNLHVLNNQAQAVPFSAIATPIMKFSPDYLNRYNLHLAAQIQGNPAAGVSSSEAMNAICGIVDKIIPESMSYEWTDMSYQEMNEGNKGPFILLLSVIFIFLFLAALYQSWLLPFSVLPVIPVALAGALTALFIGNINNNIYTQIGLILLFGMACKTSILVVDFAKQRHQSGVSALEAACYAQKLRFRAVLMTALAFTLGTLPLAISSGPGSAGECSIGIPVVGGMVGTLIGGVLLSPIFYVVISKRRPKINSAARMNLILLA